VDRKYLIWDFDGTLGHRVEAWRGPLAEVLLREFPESNLTAVDFRPYLQGGFRWHNPERVHRAGLSSDDWWAELLPVFENAFRRAAGLSDGDAQRMARAVRGCYLDPQYWRVFDDVSPCLAELTAAGWRHVVLSNHVPELPQIIGALGLSPHIEQIFNSAETGYEKPHPQAFRNVIDALGDVDALWMIGDSVTADVGGANAAGIPAILVRGRHPDSEHCCEGLDGLDAVLSLGKSSSG
jgi:putative hydrolase of the HAD superfamily